MVESHFLFVVQTVTIRKLCWTNLLTLKTNQKSLTACDDKLFLSCRLLAASFLWINRKPIEKSLNRKMVRSGPAMWKLSNQTPFFFNQKRDFNDSHVAESFSFLSLASSRSKSIYRNFYFSFNWKSDENGVHVSSANISRNAFWEVFSRHTNLHPAGCVNATSSNHRNQHREPRLSPRELFVRPSEAQAGVSVWGRWGIQTLSILIIKWSSRIVWRDIERFFPSRNSWGNWLLFALLHEKLIKSNIK